MKQFHVLITKSSADYQLIDSGDNQKLERFGNVVLSRPDPQALWRKNQPDTWKKISGNFIQEEKKGDWKLNLDIPKKWQIKHGGINFIIKPTAFKHVGLFPEQSVNWDWLRNIIGSKKESVNVLNLFGYTGGASLACAQAGASVAHVDGSKSAIAWARENAEISGLKDKPIRWLLDDAPSFVKKEIKRGKKYDGIIMDPPSFGHGPNKELWKIEDNFVNLIEDCMKILSDKPLFFLINGYSAGYSALAYENNLKILVDKFGGKIEVGELSIEESSTGRLLPCGIFARWSR